VVDAQRAAAFLREHPRVVFATFRADGRPQLSPVLAAVDDDGRVVVSTRETAMKTRNLRRDPRVAACAVSDAFYGDWVQVVGQAEIIALPEAMDLLVDYYRRLSGEHDDWADYRSAMERDRRVVVRFAIDRAGPNVSG
jgi:PPOX class probable F420-dependent enzyme